MAAPLARREVRHRPGRAVLLVCTIGLAVAFTTAAFGFAEQVSLGLDDPGGAIPTLPEGSVLVSPRANDITTSTAIDESVLDEVRATRGVLSANGLLDQPVSFALRADQQPGRPVQLRGLVLSSAYDESRWRTVAGRPPVQPDEIAVDRGGAIVGEAPLGSVARLELPTGTRCVEVVGVVTPVGAPDPVGEQGSAPGDATPDGTLPDDIPPDGTLPDDIPPDGTLPDGMLSDADLAGVALSSAHAVLPGAHAAEMLGAVEKLDRISVVPDVGIQPEALARSLRSRLSDGLDVITISDRTQGTQETVARLDGGVRSGLLAFAGVTVLVAGLAVANIYTVLLAQRTRELALLRLVGARRVQLGALVMREALMAAAAGTFIGLCSGVLLARTAVAVVRPLGVEPALELSWSMVAAATIVGLAVTLGGALVPAVRASRHAPLEAVSDTRAGSDRAVRGRYVVALVAGGVALLAGSRLMGGPSSIPGVASMILGVALGVGGITLSSRWFVRPLCSVASRPLEIIAGTTARLGVGNVARSPNRAAAAASTLMVTMVLVGAVATFGSGVRQGVEEQFATTGRADLFVERRGLVRVDTGALFSAFGDRLAPVRAGAEIVSVDGILIGPSGTESQVSASGLDRLAAMIDLGIVAGDPGARPTGGGDTSRGRGTPSGDGHAGGRHLGDEHAGDGTVLLSEQAAGELGADPGDRIMLRSTSGREAPLEVVAVYRNSAFVGPAVVGWPAVRETGSEGTFELAALDVSQNASVSRTEARLRRVADGFPRVRVHTPGEFEALNASVVDTVLRIIGVLLAASVGIGILGLASTLALSVHERRREIVMLRAVGAQRRQIRSIVGVEAALVSALAAVAGLGGGAALGWLAARFAPDTLAATAPLPWGVLFGVAGAAVCVGWLVGVVVAHRAARISPAHVGSVD